MSKNILFSAVLVSIFLAGCGGLLPKERSKTYSRWKSFEEAKEAFDGIKPFRTTTEELSAAGFDPEITPNIKILTYLDVIRLFIPNDTIKKEDLDKGVLECIEQKEHCRAYAMDLQNLYSKRYGSFWKDFLQFERKTRESGWKFNALVIILNQTVVYKLWGGEPVILKENVKKKPLGPLQEIDIIKPRPISP